MPTATATLYFKEGSSDKVYTANLEDTPQGCLVTFAYGRRGNALTTGTKTATPIPYEQAKQIFDKLIKEKTGKGYKPAGQDTTYANIAREQRDTGLRPQLLNPIDEAEAARLLSDPAYWAQEKFDGRRTFIKKQGSDIIATNRMGLSVGLLDTVLQVAQSIAHDFIIDGELMGDSLCAFDILALDGQPLTGIRYSVRLEALHRTFGALTGGIIVTSTARTTSDKTVMYAQFQAEKKEGVVFKRHDAVYTPGRPNSGGDQFKFKFYATCSAIAASGRNGKRSIALELVDGQRITQIGNVTVPANQDIPQPGQIVEIRYLYAYPQGSLYQPVLLGVRDDIEREACTIGQLTFKTPVENTDDEL